MNSWFTYWEVNLDAELNDSDTAVNWWYTELMRQYTKDEISQMNETTNLEEQGVDRGTGLTLWDTEYHRIYHAKPSMNGRYSCVLFNVFNATYNRTFITDSFQLIVGQPPSIFVLVSANLEFSTQHNILMLGK